MERYAMFKQGRASGRRAWQAIEHKFKRPRLRISFDVDDTLACLPHHAEAEHSKLPDCVHRWLGEPLRQGTRTLMRDLRRQGCSIWIYTSSGRTPAYIRRWLMLYGIHVDGVVNSVRHQKKVVDVRGLANTPSKYPPAFDIDLHVDDSEGVGIEGDDHGFRVVVVDPQDQSWAHKVMEAAANAQAQLAWQQSFKHPASVCPRAAQALTS